MEIDKSDPILTTENDGADQTLRKRIRKQWAWILLGAASIFIFTLFKLPDTKIKALIQGQIHQALGSMGVSLSASESYLSYIFGPRYIMKSVHVRWTPTSNPVILDEVRVSTSLASLLLGRVSASVYIVQTHGKTKGTTDLDFKISGNRFSTDIALDDMDLGKIGVLQALAHVDASLPVSGSITLTGDFQAPSALSGDVQLSINKWSMPPQTIAGFNTPQVSIAKSRFKISIKNGRMQCDDCSVGTSTPPDDLSGTLKGTADLAKSMGSSRINAETRFRVSEKVKSAFVFLDSLLPPGSVQPDGSYALLLSGPMDMMMAGPITK